MSSQVSFNRKIHRPWELFFLLEGVRGYDFGADEKQQDLGGCERRQAGGDPREERQLCTAHYTTVFSQCEVSSNLVG